MSKETDCPRCGGHGVMMRYADAFGEYDDCLICGYHREALSGPPITRTLAVKRLRRNPAHRGRKL